MSKKDTIYIDVEDDITSVISKATSASSHIVALVLPKRFSTLQSSVNMKLLKKAMSDKKKRLVLITSEKSLMPLAATAGVHVASSLNSRPAIPEVDASELAAETYGDEPDVDESASVGALAGAPLAAAAATGKADAKPEVDADCKKMLDRIKWPGKLSVPNFVRFRWRVFLAIFVVLLLIGGYVYAFRILPSANVVIEAETSTLPTNFDFTASLNTDEDNLDSNVLAAEVKEVKKTVSQTFQATGEKDVGKKASGTMTVQNCDSSDDIIVPSGTTFVDTTSGFSFNSTSEVAVPGGSFSGGGCDAPGEAEVQVQANESGDEKNLSARGYSVNGFSDFVTGFGSAMSGGTTEIVSIVTKGDVNRARNNLLDQEDGEVLTELTSEFGDDVVVLGETFDQQANNPKPSPGVGQEADEGRITANFTYSIVAVNRDSLAELVEQKLVNRIGTGNQVVLENGIDDAVIELIESDDGVYSLEYDSDAVIGPDLDLEQIAQEIEGMEFSEARATIIDKPGVRDVIIDFSPSWVFSVPAPDKVNIEINIEGQDDVEQDDSASDEQNQAEDTNE